MYIIKTREEGATYYSCAYPSCSDGHHFGARRQAVAHIRRAHFKEKPFKCLAWCVLFPVVSRVNVECYWGYIARSAFRWGRMLDGMLIRGTMERSTRVLSGRRFPRTFPGLFIYSVHPTVKKRIPVNTPAINIRGAVSWKKGRNEKQVMYFYQLKFSSSVYGTQVVTFVQSLNSILFHLQDCVIHKASRVLPHDCTV